MIEEKQVKEEKKLKWENEHATEKRRKKEGRIACS